LYKESPMVLLEFSIAPVGQGESVSAHVARVLDVIDRSGISYQLTPMGTIIEGEWADTMDLVTQCFDCLPLISRAWPCTSRWTIAPDTKAG
jgi:uncharacterized protein (TIGR00106 family)